MNLVKDRSRSQSLIIPEEAVILEKDKKFALLVLFGIISFERLPVREYPDIDPPVVSVESKYPGAAAVFCVATVSRWWVSES